MCCAVLHWLKDQVVVSAACIAGLHPGDPLCAVLCHAALAEGPLLSAGDGHGQLQPTLWRQAVVGCLLGLHNHWLCLQGEMQA
jgi:hypothetical protein